MPQRDRREVSEQLLRFFQFLMSPGASLGPRRVEGALGDFEAGASRRMSRLKGGRGEEQRDDGNTKGEKWGGGRTRDMHLCTALKSEWALCECM